MQVKLCLLKKNLIFQMSMDYKWHGPLEQMVLWDGGVSERKPLEN